jgi:hypothetical protein
MPLNLPWDANTYTVCLFPNEAASVGNAVPFVSMRISRRQLEDWATGDERQFNHSVLEEFRRFSPGEVENLSADEVKVRLEKGDQDRNPAWRD